MTGPERRMAQILNQMGLTYWPQHKVGRHSIDFVLPSERGEVLLQVNGWAWHRWEKVVKSDRVALDRLLGAGYLVLGVWDWRLKEPREVKLAIAEAFRDRRIRWWDWLVCPSTLSPEAIDHLAGFAASSAVLEEVTASPSRTMWGARVPEVQR